VPFEKYAGAAQELATPSSAARALFGGAPNIERVDRAGENHRTPEGMRLDASTKIVALVDARLEATTASDGPLASRCGT